MSTVSQMLREIREIPDAVARLLDRSGAAIAKAAADASARSPAFLATVARGSSDHAATYLKYACELTLGLPVASIGPSVASIYHAPLRLAGGICVVISQSGKSPDIVEMARAATSGGALTVALTNDPASPLAGAAGRVIDIAAGPELSVAATKTFVTSAVAALALVAEWAGDAALLAAIHALPGALDRAARVDWGGLTDRLATAESVFTLGRGPGFAVSGEAALKLKETCRIHAENYSSAEVLHGPVTIVGQGFPVLAFAAADAAEESVATVADALAGKGAEVFVTSDRVRRARPLPGVRTDHPLTDPIALIVSFYAMVEAVARARGIDPDRPRHLSKVTETT
ncbi:SIS domain-containing protein [Albidovulum sp.]|uniref:SIS domain-containing protein n=1 Tax=Albidovulum sp. TaxID=1872424 RepID=UPI0039B9415D